MERKYDLDQHIAYVDEHGVRHGALPTIWWGVSAPAYTSASGEPGCNLLFVTGDEEKRDPYGRQIERRTSVVHKSKQAANGNYWCWPDE